MWLGVRCTKWYSGLIEIIITNCTCIQYWLEIRFTSRITNCGLHPSNYGLQIVFKHVYTSIICFRWWLRVLAPTPSIWVSQRAIKREANLALNYGLQASNCGLQSLEPKYGWPFAFYHLRTATGASQAYPNVHRTPQQLNFHFCQNR